MSNLVWCAVNVSEGQNESTLQRIQNLFTHSEGIQFKHVDIGQSVNRSVWSFFAELNQLPAFADAFFQLCLQQIDMRNHKGSHPRIGAVDVFPVVPIGNTSQQEVIEVVNSMASQISTDFNVPIYLYEDSQAKLYRRRLEQIRKGGYEGLEQKMNKAKWQPDFGASYNAKAGATVMGVRQPLVAINFAINSNKVELAKQIAKQIRASNTKSKFAMQGVKAIGWSIPEYNTVQVSVNHTRTVQVSLKTIFDTINKIASEHNATIIETELIGLLPQSILLNDFSTIDEAVEYYKLNNKKNPNLLGRIIDVEIK